jgi:hypothetical protein
MIPLETLLDFSFFVWFFLSDKKMEAAQVFIKTEEEEEKEDVLMDSDKFPPEETSCTEPAKLER